MNSKGDFFVYLSSTIWTAHCSTKVYFLTDRAKHSTITRFEMIPCVVLILAFVSFQVTSSEILKEKIEPVDLNHFCINTEEKEATNTKSPILLIHGAGTSLANWDGVQQVLALRTGRRVCAVDLRNHGDSPWNNQTELETLTADISHFLNKEKIQNINLIGHSLGGKIAVHFTLNNPERVDSLVVEDMRPNGVAPMALQNVKAIIQLLQIAIKVVPDGSTEDEARKTVMEFILKKITEMNGGKPPNETPRMPLQITCSDGKCKYKFNIDIFAQMLDEDLSESTGVYEGPSLFIFGRKSLFKVDEDRTNIMKLFPNAKLVGVEEANHHIHGKFREFEDEVIMLLNKESSVCTKKEDEFSISDEL